MWVFLSRLVFEVGLFAKWRVGEREPRLRSAGFAEKDPAVSQSRSPARLPARTSTQAEGRLPQGPHSIREPGCCHGNPTALRPLRNLPFAGVSADGPVSRRDVRGKVRALKFTHASREAEAGGRHWGRPMRLLHSMLGAYDKSEGQVWLWPAAVAERSHTGLQIVVPTTPFRFRAISVSHRPVMN